MATLTLATEHRAVLDDLARVAAADVVALWRQLDPSDARSTTAALVEFIPDLTSAHGDTAAVLAADYYDETRAAAQAPGRYRATIGHPRPASQVEAVTRWSVWPLWSTTPDYQAALANVVGTTLRMVRLPARTTIRDNAATDPASRGVVRVTAPDACAFCLLVATRPDHADLTLTSPGRWHTNCRCGEAPRFANDGWPDPADLYREFKAATAGLSGAEARRAWDRHVRSTRET